VIYKARAAGAQDPATDDSRTAPRLTEEFTPITQPTHETAPTQFIQVGGTRFAYRRFGRKGDVPLLLLNYLAANMDNWDPKVTNGLAAEHDVILVDYPGIGGSSGETPSTVAALAKACVAFCRALEITRFDVVGYDLQCCGRSINHSSYMGTRTWSSCPSTRCCSSSISPMRNSSCIPTPVTRHTLSTPTPS
jgi:alpha/beta hydrolase family protein